MSVKIRLTRMGKRKQPSYRVVVMDSRRPRDGAYIEQIGTYDPRREPSVVDIDNDKAVDWLRKGAQPTDRARKLLEISGAWTRFRVAKGDIHTIGHTSDEAAQPPVESAPEPVEDAGAPADAATPVAAESADGTAEESTEPAPVEVAATDAETDGAVEDAGAEAPDAAEETPA
jgi:small subunit ribosomal protein S16